MSDNHKRIGYIETTLRTDEEIDKLKQQIVNTIGNRYVKQLRLNVAVPNKIRLEFDGDDSNAREGIGSYNLKVNMTIFDNDIITKIYDMFMELEHIYFVNTLDNFF